MKFLVLGTYTGCLYTPGATRITVLQVLPRGTASIACCTVEKLPEPSCATVSTLAAILTREGIQKTRNTRTRECMSVCIWNGDGIDCGETTRTMKRLINEFNEVCFVCVFFEYGSWNQFHDISMHRTTLLNFFFRNYWIWVLTEFILISCFIMIILINKNNRKPMDLKLVNWFW